MTIVMAVGEYADSRPTQVTILLLSNDILDSALPSAWNLSMLDVRNKVTQPEERRLSRMILAVWLEGEHPHDSVQTQLVISRRLPRLRSVCVYALPQAID
jgi:hypothetical protein